MNTASKLSGTVSKAATVLSMDDDWQRERARRARNKPKDIGDGMLQGAKDLGTGVMKGITGVVLDPLKGAQKDGATGFFKGIGKGMTGLVLKPVVGVIDTFTDVTEGIKNATRDREDVRRARPPRFFGEDRTLVDYERSRSIGQYLLYSICEGRFASHYYRYHCVNKNSIIIVSNEAVIQLYGDPTKESLDAFSVREVVPLHQLTSAEANGDGKGVLLNFDYMRKEPPKFLGISAVNSVDNLVSAINEAIKKQVRFGKNFERLHMKGEKIGERVGGESSRSVGKNKKGRLRQSSSTELVNLSTESTELLSGYERKKSTLSVFSWQVGATIGFIVVLAALICAILIFFIYRLEK